MKKLLIAAADDRLITKNKYATDDEKGRERLSAHYPVSHETRWTSVPRVMVLSYKYIYIFIHTHI